MNAPNPGPAWQRSRAALQATWGHPAPVPDPWDPDAEQARLDRLLADLASYAHTSGLTFLPSAIDGWCAVNCAARHAALTPLPFPEEAGR